MYVSRFSSQRACGALDPRGRVLRPARLGSGSVSAFTCEDREPRFREGRASLHGNRLGSCAAGSRALRRPEGAAPNQLGDLDGFDADDRLWLRRYPTKQGRFNAGQKLNAAVTAAFAVLFAISGCFFVQCGASATRGSVSRGRSCCMMVRRHLAHGTSLPRADLSQLVPPARDCPRGRRARLGLAALLQMGQGSPRERADRRRADGDVQGSGRRQH